MTTRRSLAARLFVLLLALASTGSPSGALARPAEAHADTRPLVHATADGLGDPYLVADLTTAGNPEGSEPYGYVGLSSAIYFVARTPATGDELWRTDGTLTGTVPVGELYPGEERGIEDASSAPQSTLVTYAGRLYFAGRNAHHGTELWASDGTLTGTILVRDIATGTERSEPEFLLPYNGELYFAADDDVHGQELWKTDGTLTGTVLVDEAYPGSPGASLDGLIEYDDRLWFNANSPGQGFELWVSDGTPTGTVQFMNIASGSASAWPQEFRTAGGRLYFTADTTAEGRELWVTDGTLTGTLLLNDINPGPDDSYIYESPMAAGGQLFFRAYDPTYGDELWRSNGTVSGTVRVADIYSGTNGSSPSYMTLYSGAIYYWADDGVHGNELWRTTLTTTQLVTDIMPLGGQIGSGPLFAHSGDLYFTASDGVYGRELWRYDGVAATRLTDLNPGAADAWPGNFFGPNANNLFFSASDGVQGYELYRLNLVTDEITFVKNIAPDVVSSDLEDLSGAGQGQIFFEGYFNATGGEPYTSDGTEAGTLALGDFYAGNGGSNPAPFVGLGDGRAVFQMRTLTTGAEPWISDGTPGGTLLLRDILTGTASSDPDDFAPLGDLTVFFADDDVLGEELWRTDGTPGGTLFVRDIYTGSASGYNGWSTALGSLLLFGADDGVHGDELWASDGTFDGTRRLTDHSSNGYEDLYPYDLVTAGSRVFFVGYDEDGNDSLYLSDGVSVTKVIDYDDTGLSYFNDLRPGVSGVFFEDSLPGQPLNIWWTDGYTYTQLTAFTAADEPLDLASALPVGDRVFFRHCDLVIGCELWQASPAGSGLVRDIYPGLQSSDPTDLTAVDGRLVFAAADPAGGRELWISDGTEAGTQPLAEVVPGPGHSNPTEMTVSGNRLFFLAYSEATGNELWALSLTQPLFLPMILR